MKKVGSLTLIPTPIEEIGTLPHYDIEFIKNALDEGIKILIEDIKPARRRWTGWGLPRETIEELIPFNEHTQKELTREIIEDMKRGGHYLLLSDGGLPAFCDPGQYLVWECHQHNILVRSRPFFNSTMLAVVLSGFPSSQFFFGGFPPVKKEERIKFLKEKMLRGETLVLMDTPYRLGRIIEECSQVDGKRWAFLAMDLCCESEEYILKRLGDLERYIAKNKQKREFILVLGPKKFEG